MVTLSALILLSVLSITVIYSSSPQLAVSQAIFCIIGLAIYLGLSKFDYRSIISLIKPFYFIIIVLLLIVLFLGFETRGSVRWISLGFFNLQPSEFAKIALILGLASFWSKSEASWRNILKSFLILLPIGGLVFEQPDLGTALTLGFIWVGMLVASNISLIKISLMSMVGMLLLPVSWFLLRDYQKQRVLSFIFPNYDPLGAGYNVIQSMIAVGSGQFFGRGLGRGTQSRLQFLPEFRTDFIFASITEELGMIGSLIVLSLYATIFFSAFRLLGKIKDRFGELVVIGVLSMLIFQIVVNIGMNIGVMPVTGITLPLLSYGGSSVITTFASLGLVASVRKYGIKSWEVDSFHLGR